MNVNVTKNPHQVYNTFRCVEEQESNESNLYKEILKKKIHYSLNLEDKIR